MKSDDSKPNTVDLETAKTWTRTWRGVEGSYNAHNNCHGFLIPAEDLRGLLAEIENQPNVQYVRAYLGVDAVKNEEKLVIVGTEPEDGGEDYKDLITGYNGTGLIWDFVKPCPPKCDQNSPLNK